MFSVANKTKLANLHVAINLANQAPEELSTLNSEIKSLREMVEKTVINSNPELEAVRVKGINTLLDTLSTAKDKTQSELVKNIGFELGSNPNRWYSEMLDIASEQYIDMVNESAKEGRHIYDAAATFTFKHGSMFLRDHFVKTIEELSKVHGFEYRIVDTTKLENKGDESDLEVVTSIVAMNIIGEAIHKQALEKEFFSYDSFNAYYRFMVIDLMNEQSIDEILADEKLWEQVNAKYSRSRNPLEEATIVVFESYFFRDYEFHKELKQALFSVVCGGHVNGRRFNFVKDPENDRSKYLPVDNARDFLASIVAE